MWRSICNHHVYMLNTSEVSCLRWRYSCSGAGWKSIYFKLVVPYHHWPPCWLNLILTILAPASSTEGLLWSSMSVHLPVHSHHPWQPDHPTGLPNESMKLVVWFKMACYRMMLLMGHIDLNLHARQGIFSHRWRSMILFMKVSQQRQIVVPDDPPRGLRQGICIYHVNMYWWVPFNIFGVPAERNSHSLITHTHRTGSPVSAVACI